MEQNELNWFTSLKKELTEYIDLKIEITRLTIYEKSAKLSAALASVVVITFLTFLFFFFIFIAVAIWIGDMLQNRALGFLIVACFYLLLLIIFMLMRKKVIEKNIVNKVIEILTEDDHEETNQ